MSENQSVSILILCCNKAAYTKRCLDSLFLSSLRPFQVVLVNNGSTDDTADVLNDFISKASKDNISTELITTKENIGAIEGRNRGMEKMTGAFHVFLDNDIVVCSKNWLEQLRDGLLKDPKVGVIGPKLIYPNAPHDIQCAGCEVTEGGRVSFEGRGNERKDPEFIVPRDCKTLISACWMMRGEFKDTIGPLDDLFSPVQFEDIDYCYRIREAGYNCRYTPDVEMYHFENVTTGRTQSLNYPYLTVKNGLKFKQKWEERIAKEGGPDDSEWQWAQIPTVTFDEVPERLPTK